MALPGMGHLPVKGEGEQVTARVLYVAATRTTQRLVIGVGRGFRESTEGIDLPNLLLVRVVSIVWQWRN